MLHRFVLQLNMPKQRLEEPQDYCKHASKPENKAALARYNQRAQSFDTLGQHRYDDDDDAEANINVDGDVNNETTDDKHQEYYYHDIVKQGDYYPQERGEPALPLSLQDPLQHAKHTLEQGGARSDKADTIHIVANTDDEDNSTSSGDHALSTVAQRRPPAPDLLDSGANRYVFGNTTATITDRKEARVTSLKNISGQPRRITQQATVQPLWVGGNGRTYSPAINNALIDESLDFSLLPVSHFDTELHKAPVSKWASVHTTTAHTRERGEIDARGRLTKSRLYRMDTPDDQPLNPNQRYAPHETAITYFSYNPNHLQQP
eukprot:g77103.t1